MANVQDVWLEGKSHHTDRRHGANQVESAIKCGLQTCRDPAGNMAGFDAKNRTFSG